MTSFQDVSTSPQDVSALPMRSAAEGLLSLKNGSALGNAIGKGRFNFFPFSFPLSSVPC
jgi:hypothetical protein